MNRFGSILVGAALLLWGLYQTQQTLALKSAGGRATGSVIAAKVSHERRSDSNWFGSDSFAPVVEFVAEDGKNYQFISTVSSSYFGYKLGEKVPVLYEKRSPTDARIDGFMVNWFFPILLVGLGGWTLLWGLGLVKTRDGLSPLRSRRRDDYFD